MGSGGVQLVLSDVDGTLLTSDGALTDASVDAVHALHASGVAFTVTSSRPPQGLAMLIEPLAIDVPIGAFNGGVFVDSALRVIDQHPLALGVVAQVVAMLDDAGLSPWVYTGTTWFVRDADGPHVQHESDVTQLVPTVTDDLVSALGDGAGDAAKVVGVSDDHPLVAAAEASVSAALGEAVSATRSQTYYLDVTNPAANKGEVVDYLARVLAIPAAAIATIGDGGNDTLMFARSGISIAMGNASDEVKGTATLVTAANDDDGFARAVHELVLPTR